MCSSWYSSDIDDCYPSPCENNGTCIDGVNNYKCACVPGFEGKNCSIGKLSNNFDQPILLFKSQQKCFLGVVLNNNVRWTSENIICYLISLFFLFSDIDDCDPYPCLNNGACIDGVNNYTCACSSGFEGRNCSISKFFIIIITTFIMLVFLS